MEFLLRYFIDGNVYCEGHKWTYTHAARMIIPRIGERVCLDNDTCVEVDMVTYSPSPVGQFKQALIPLVSSAVKPSSSTAFGYLAALIASSSPYTRTLDTLGN